MGIIDKVAAVLPWRGERHDPARADVLALRNDFDRWLEPFFEETRHLFPEMTDFAWTPSAGVQETDQELIVTAEVPGLDRDDLDLSITSGLDDPRRQAGGGRDQAQRLSVRRTPLWELRPDGAAAPRARR